MKFTPNTLYRLSASDAEFFTNEASEMFNDDREYEFARSEGYANGAIIADVWIQDKDGNIHPGYRNSPVPMNISELTAIA